MSHPIMGALAASLCTGTKKFCATDKWALSRLTIIVVTVRVFADCSQGWKSTFEAVNLHDPDIIQQTIITTFFPISGLFIFEIIRIDVNIMILAKPTVVIFFSSERSFPAFIEGTKHIMAYRL